MYRWRVQFMEKSIQALDFINVDQMIQVHGNLNVYIMALTKA
jgi:hypothetical protein